jgi:Na+/H+ antiporter NhaC
MVVLAVAGILVAIALGAYVALNYRSTIDTPFRIGLTAWNVIRILATAGLLWGLWMTGRTGAQLLAVVIGVLIGIYVVIEQPIRSNTNRI